MNYYYKLHRKIRNSERIFYYFFFVFHPQLRISLHEQHFELQREYCQCNTCFTTHYSHWIFLSNVYLIYFHLKLTYNVIISFRQVNKHLHFFFFSDSTLELEIWRWESLSNILLEIIIRKMDVSCSIMKIWLYL